QSDFDQTTDSVLDSVRQKVQEHLLETHSVPSSDRVRLLEDLDRASAAVERRAQPPDDLGDELRQVEFARLKLKTAARQARDVEQVIDENDEPRRLDASDLDLSHKLSAR